MSSNSDIAIIGMSCNFPGSDNLSDYWSLLRSGSCSISKFDLNSIDNEIFKNINFPNKNYMPYRGVLNNVNLSMPINTKFNQQESEHINSEGRILLNLTYSAIEDAGLTNTLIHNTSVFASESSGFLSSSSNKKIGEAHTMDGILDLGYSRSLSSIISYEFDFRANSITFHTGCSSSLISIVQACSDLNTYQSDYSICCSISYANPQNVGYFYEKEGTFSSKGQCLPFDNDADGTVISNGAAVIILKRYTDALKDGNKIYSIIKGGSSNNDGRLKTSFASPSVQSQYNCISSALKNSSLSIDDLSYIECHGSATPVGDLMEIFALKKILKKKYKNKFCSIGSVKSNIGHTTVVSGLASVIKCSLMIKNSEFVPLSGFKKNSNISLENTPFYFSKKLEIIHKSNNLINIGVSNFGFGGANAHIILSGC